MRAEAGPTISLIINNHNHARFLPAAIESALALGAAVLEVVVVDDGSTDDSREVIARYAERIVVVLQANGGQLSACLNALGRTTGDYVYFLDADDMVSPAFAEAAPRALASRPAKLQFQLRSVGPVGEPLDSVFPSFPSPYPQAAVLADMEHWGLYVSPPTSGNVFRRDVVERLRGERIDYESAVDGLALYLAPLMGEVVTIDRPLACYRLHGSNLHQQHVLDPARLRREIARTTARGAHIARISHGDDGRGQPPRPAAMTREWAMMADVAEGRRPRVKDAGSMLRGLWRASFGPGFKLTMSAWAIAVLVLPDRARRTACAWRLSPLNRPRWLNRRLSGHRSA